MPLYMIAAVDKNRGIAKEGNIPWKLPEDTQYFKDKTTNNTVVMGSSTFYTLPSHPKPLPNRYNIIVTRNDDLIKIDTFTVPDVTFESMEFVEEYIKNNRNDKDIYIMGGSTIYNYFVKRCDKIYLTIIEKNYECDTFFPYIPNNYEIDTVSESKYDDNEKVNFRFVEYKFTKFPCTNEDQYLHLAYDILNKGNDRPDRTGTGTRSLFGRQMRFDISKSLPILTTKRVPIKLTIEELLFFLRGDTNTKILEDKGITIWRGNTSRQFLDSVGLTEYKEFDFGALIWVSYGVIGDAHILAVIKTILEKELIN